MKKSVWGNAVWLLFHTLAIKLKPEFNSETPILFSHIVAICNNLPCPDCQEHASNLLMRANHKAVTASRENLIHFLHDFHNVVNKRISTPVFSKEGLQKYANANTKNVVAHFMNIMGSNMHNDKLMMQTFRRQNYMNKFINYIKTNSYKYNN